MLGFDANKLGGIVLSVCIVLVSTILHEIAHAVTAYKLGDATAKEQGRITLNPAAHLDPVGSVLLPVLMAAAGGPVFAFAKPVPYNPNRLRHPVRDEVLVALAGPACNLVQALVGAVAFRGCAQIYVAGAGASEGLYFVIILLRDYVIINLTLMFFNLIPLPPLDGSAIVFPLLKGEARKRYYTIQAYAMPILLVALYLLPMVLRVDPVGDYLSLTVGGLLPLLLGLG